MILDDHDLAPLSVDVAMTIQGSDGSHWRILVRPTGGRRRGPRDGHRPGFGKGEDRRGNERGKEPESAEQRTWDPGTDAQVQVHHRETAGLLIL